MTAEPETNACEALLQLAGGGVHHAIPHVAASGDTTRYSIVLDCNRFVLFCRLIFCFRSLLVDNCH